MSNVHFIGSLHPMEKEQDAKTEHVRGMHDSAYRQSVIRLKPSMLDRFILLAERGWSRLCARVSAASARRVRRIKRAWNHITSDGSF
jgi:hypothetical protein